MNLRPVAFIDRDGTILAERSYLSDPANVELLPGAVDGLKMLREAGLALVTVTNQSGIARGLYTEADYHAVAGRVAELLAADGIRMDDTRYCPHHPDVSGPCDCRKPNVGMHLLAAAELGLEVTDSYCVGDKLTDVEAAIELRGRGILVRTGYGSEHEARIPAGTWVADDLREAAALIARDRRR